MKPEYRKTHELRTEAIRLHDECGLTARDLSQMFNIDEVQVKKWLEIIVVEV